MGQTIQASHKIQKAKEWGYCQNQKSKLKSLDPTKLKQFWKGIKVLNRGASVIPPLSHEGVTADSSLGKANMLNNYFAT